MFLKKSFNAFFLLFGQKLKIKEKFRYAINKGKILLCFIIISKNIHKKCLYVENIYNNVKKKL